MKIKKKEARNGSIGWKSLTEMSVETFSYIQIEVLFSGGHVNHKLGWVYVQMYFHWRGSFPQLTPVTSYTNYPHLRTRMNGSEIRKIQNIESI